MVLVQVVSSGFCKDFKNTISYGAMEHLRWLLLFVLFRFVNLLIKLQKSKVQSREVLHAIIENVDKEFISSLFIEERTFEKARKLNSKLFGFTIIQKSIENIM